MACFRGGFAGAEREAPDKLVFQWRFAMARFLFIILAIVKNLDDRLAK